MKFKKPKAAVTGIDPAVPDHDLSCIIIRKDGDAIAYDGKHYSERALLLDEACQFERPRLSEDEFYRDIANTVKYFGPPIWKEAKPDSESESNKTSPDFYPFRSANPDYQLKQDVYPSSDLSHLDEYVKAVQEATEEMSNRLGIPNQIESNDDKR